MKTPRSFLIAALLALCLAQARIGLPDEWERASL